jgi:predicted RNA-binding protein with PUA-like domain
MKKTKTKATAQSKAKAPAKPPLKPKEGPPVFVSTGYWLLKSEPDCYSIDAFARERKTLWTGIRNYQARNFMMNSMKPGDKFLFYHSSAEPPAVAGVGEIVRAHLPDPTALDPKDDHFDAKASSEMPIWYCAEVAFKQKFQHAIPLATIRAQKPLAKMALLAPGQRLSVQPVKEAEFRLILSLAGAE